MFFFSRPLARDHGTGEEHIGTVVEANLVEGQGGTGWVNAIRQ